MPLNAPTLSEIKTKLAQLSPPKLTIPERWIPTPIGSIEPEAPIGKWVWEGLLAPGFITLLSAEAKAGKSTLFGLLLTRLVTGGTLWGTDVTPGKALVVSEEPKGIWHIRNKRLGLTDNPNVISIPFPTKPSKSEWEHFIRHLTAYVKDHQLSLVIFDTLSHLWYLEDENDNAKVATALMPLRILSGAGPSVLIVHHFGTEKNGPRGGTELRGFPDLLADFYVHTPTDILDRRRTIRIRGRLLPSTEITARLNEAETEYEVIEGDLLSATAKLNIWETLKTMVPNEPPGMTAGDFLNSWPNAEKHTESSIHKAIAANWQQAGWQKQGTGAKGNAQRYWKPQTQEK